jgi:putative Mg2+ transporter-C (MgtC) family protein
MDTQTILIRILLALLIGAAIGAERESSNKSAGFRTMILISLGSCLFTLFSVMIGDQDNTDRIASNIVTGIGFIGAGVIFKEGYGVQGLTTAASIWLTAALGMGVGGGFYVAAIAGCLLALIILLTFTSLENVIEKINQVRYYKIVCDYRQDVLEEHDQLFKKFHLRAMRVKSTRNGNTYTGEWSLRGTEKNHRLFSVHVLADGSVKEFEY